MVHCSGNPAARGKGVGCFVFLFDGFMSKHITLTYVNMNYMGFTWSFLLWLFQGSGWRYMSKSTRSCRGAFDCQRGSLGKIFTKEIDTTTKSIVELHRYGNHT